MQIDSGRTLSRHRESKDRPEKLTSQGQGDTGGTEFPT